jgi:transposase
MSSTRCSTWRRTAAKWRALPEQFGNWHTIYTRLRRWAAAGVLDRAFQALQEHRLIRIRVEVCRLGQHQREGPPRGHGGAKKNGPQATGKSRGGRTTKSHLVAANARMALPFARSPGPAHDAPEGRKLLTGWHRRPEQVPLVMDRAYEGDETRQLVLQLGFEPVVPANPNRLRPWTYDRSLDRRRHEIERLFRRLKGFSPHSHASQSSISCSPPASSSH